MPVWRPAFQAGGVATGAVRSAARGGREAGVAGRGRGDGRGAECGAGRSGGRRCRPVRRRCCWVRCRGGSRPLRVGLRRAQRGALRVPVWRPAFQAGGVATGAARSAARGGREAGVAGRCVAGAVGFGAEVGTALCGWGCDVRSAERCACRSGDRRSKPGAWRRARCGVRRGAVGRPALQAGCVAGAVGFGAEVRAALCGWGCDLRSAERCACRSGDRRSRPGAWRGARGGVRRGAVWRRAWQAGGAARVRRRRCVGGWGPVGR